MKKLIFIFLVQILCAKLIDAVAIVVDDEPITLSDIQKEIAQGLSKEEAIEKLISQTLKASKIKDLGIEISDYEVENRISLIASKNKMSVQELENLVSKRQNLQKYKQQIKESLVNEALFRSILANEMPMSEGEIEKYYKQNPSKFKQAKTAIIIQYMSLDKNSLEKMINNPLLKDDGVLQKKDRLDLQKINPNLARIIQETRVGGFTQIFNQGNRYFSFYVKEKMGVSTMPYEQASTKIKEMLIIEKRKRAIKDYFMRQRSVARIIMLRQ